MNYGRLLPGRRALSRPGLRGIQVPLLRACRTVVGARGEAPAVFTARDCRGMACAAAVALSRSPADLRA